MNFKKIIKEKEEDEDYLTYGRGGLYKGTNAKMMRQPIIPMTAKNKVALNGMMIK